ncbi:MAG: hypothetical protein EBY17_31275 [Acidobacteriia bacterium]|nr:hypothetical protein [Terriglobia bacterium]
MADSLSGLNTGPTIPAPDIVPPAPMLSALAPKLARIDPDGVAAYDAAHQKWVKDLNFRIQNGVPLTS